MVDHLIQPIYGCIGQSVGGNPTQFVMERAFAAAAIDGCVITVDVLVEEFSSALAGIRAMRFAGLAILPPYESMVSGQFEKPLVASNDASTDPCKIHALRRIGDEWQQEDLRPKAHSIFLDHFPSTRSILWLGDEPCPMEGEKSTDREFKSKELAIDWFPLEKLRDLSKASSNDSNERESGLMVSETDRSLKVESIEFNGLVVGVDLNESLRLQLDSVSWASQSACMIVRNVSSLQSWSNWCDEKGLRLWTPIDFQAAMLMQLFGYWTGARQPFQLFREALDEYYAW